MKRRNLLIGIGFIINGLALTLKHFVEGFPHWLSLSMLILGTLSIVASLFVRKKL